ncbi:MAG TPA: CxxxxCH/CxxCH domain-containing protein, partial [Myxococcales bacterium]|nr:CxxxxCH/CxxCH domain-containing protein [Myxococcales bacterium]
PVHTAAWMDAASPGFHAAPANAGLGACQGCHGADLEGTGSSSIACASCHGAAWKTSCTMCHGGTDNATGAPPRATWGNAADPVRSGAHTSHLAATHGVSQPVACDVCHVQPADALASGHIDGATATVTFSGRAQSGGALPVWTRGTATCASTYCHGGTLSAGGTNVAPVWTTLDGTQAACGTCHGVPPPPPHPANAACGECHTGYTATSVDAQKHVNGTIDVTMTCTSCHGSAANAAPPLGTHGETATTSRAVGAHQQHLAGAALGKRIACGECHVVPNTVPHANGVVDVAFGPLARSGNVQPGWDGATCSSTYCHGATLAGGKRTQPSWTVVDGSQRTCDSCHGAPPPNSSHTRTDLDCSTCHPAGNSATAGTVAATHLDAKLDVAVTCTSCHGDAARDPAIAAAPPSGTHAETDSGQLAVGAHLQHLQAGAFSKAIACEECHAVPASAQHANGTVELAFGTLAKTGNATPIWSRDTATCSSTYCHGGTLPAGGSNTAPLWTRVNGSQAACGTCHAIPPLSPHPADANCDHCHPGYTATSVNLDTHVNGKIDVILTCNSCHGSVANDAPPLGTHGETLTTARAVGAHQKHLGATLSQPVACGECHVVPTTIPHANGAAEVTFGSLAKTGGAAATWNGTSCSSTYCHGATLAAGGTNTAPTWTRVDGTQAACGTCHGVPPPAPHPADSNCGQCHVGYTSTTVDPQKHVDGKVDVLLNCSSCHGDASRAATALNPKLAAAPPAGTKGETATTTRAVGAHQQHLQDGTLSSGIACTECHAVPSDANPMHQNGTVLLTWGPLATRNGSVPVWNPSTNTCSANWCHGAKLTGGSLRTPVWTKVDGTQDRCGTCHGVPPTSGQHGRSEHRVSCGYCHGGTYTQTVADKTRHFNGIFEVNGPRIRTWNASTHSCQPTCHGSETW